MYNYMLEQGIARELARLVLPVAMYTEFYWTVNARALMNFLSLRNADAAQHEIREYAKIVEEQFSEYMPVTAKAFVENGRLAP
jgi:thymidylate synthase (FAD)